MRQYQWAWGIVFIFGLAPVLRAQVASIDSKKTSVVSAPSFSDFKQAYEAGNQALKDGGFADAAVDYAQAEKLAETPKAKGQAANSMGWALINERKWMDAKTALSRSVEEDPDYKVALKNLGVVNYRLYEYGLAGVDELKAAVTNLEASGDNPELLDRAKGDLSREDSYAQATPVAVPKLEGMGYKALVNLGDQAQAQGQFALAIKIFKQAESVAISPNSKAAAVNRQGKVLLDSHKVAEAVPYFEAAVKDQPEGKVYLNNLGFAYWALYDSGKGTKDDLKKAVDAFYKVNSVDPSFQVENLKMALAVLSTVDPDAAKAYTVKEESDADEDATPTSDDAKSQGDKASDDPSDSK